MNKEITERIIEAKERIDRLYLRIAGDVEAIGILKTLLQRTESACARLTAEYNVEFEKLLELQAERDRQKPNDEDRDGRRRTQ